MRELKKKNVELGEQHTALLEEYEACQEQAGGCPSKNANARTKFYRICFSLRFCVRSFIAFVFDARVALCRLANSMATTHQVPGTYL